MAIFEKFERPRSHSKALDDLIGRAYSDANLTHQQKAVLICLAWHAKNRAGEAYPSQATISARTGVCISLVGRAIKALCERGYIEKTERRRTDGGKTSCLIVIHGMQFFPEDYTAQTSRPSTYSMCRDHTIIPVRHTEGIGTGYGTMKQDSLKQDSSTAAPKTERQPQVQCRAREERELVSENKLASQDLSLALARLEPLRPLLTKLLAYLASNRNSLQKQDYDAIIRLEANEAYQLASQELHAKSDPRDIRRHLDRFFDRRKQKMKQPTDEALMSVTHQLEALPPALVSTAFQRLDVIYKPNWVIPPTQDHITATIRDELRLVHLVRNACVAFADAKKTYETRQRERKLPLTFPETTTDQDRLAMATSSSINAFTSTAALAQRETTIV